jgi:hypothetical protein
VRGVFCLPYMPGLPYFASLRLAGWLADWLTARLCSVATTALPSDFDSTFSSWCELRVFVLHRDPSLGTETISGLKE